MFPRRFCCSLPSLVKPSRTYRTSICRSLKQGQGMLSTNVKSLSTLMKVSNAVSEGIKLQQPIVALESTIITHGMPYPDNFRTALEVEDIIRKNNAIPATIGIIEGLLHIGLTNEELRFLSEQKNVVKTSRRDMAIVLSKGLSGGTTVSSTMIAAHKAGILVFVTGGIGGVHRGASETFDVSADLIELGKTPVAVICAGVKSILDIGLTLEFLETQGVTVVSYGKGRDFPAFFTSKSGFQAPYHLHTAEEVAELIDTNTRLNLNSGIVVSVPIPDEYNVVGEEIDKAIHKAVEEARKTEVKGKDVTPYILNQINKLTGGKSLESNIALIKNNAKIGAEVAVHLSKLRKMKDKQSTVQKDLAPLEFKPRVHVTSDSKDILKPTASRRPVVIGGSNFDIQAITETYDVLHEVTNKGKLYQTFGGVGRNIAECLTRLDTNPLFISSIGEDMNGRIIMEHFNNLNMDTCGILVTSEKPTATYSVMMNSTGEVIMGVGDMEVHNMITPDYVEEFESDIESAPIVCIDGNIPIETIERILQLCQKHNTPVWFEPTDTNKSGKPFMTDLWQTVTYTSPNKNELHGIYTAARRSQEASFQSNNAGVASEENIINECIRMSRDILQKVQLVLVITLGKYGVLVCRNAPDTDPLPNRGHDLTTAGLVSAVHYSTATDAILSSVNIESVSGAGDSLAGAMIACLLRGDDQDTCVKAGVYASFLSLQTHTTISEKISSNAFSADKIRQWTTWKPRKIAIDS